MTTLDWTVLSTYFAGILLLGAWLARRQKSTEDYFLGGRRMSPWLLGVSLSANQVSAVSLISAPAFVALSPGGGLRWLQYEFAVPLAMVGIILLLAPAYQRLTTASVYEYAERRFGPGVRLSLSFFFLLSRALATGITLYTTAMVLAVCMGLPVLQVYWVLGIFAIAYTTLGGIQADVYSDAIQFAVLWAGTVAAMFVALGLIGDFSEALSRVEPARLTAVDIRHHGAGDGHTFSFWPMLLGGLFLYMSYYGCDQTQAQRLLAAGSAASARRSLVVNGLIRFPLVLTYCLFGILLAALLTKDASLAGQVAAAGKPDYLVPTFLASYLPQGLRGLVMAGIFAATMSSIDSALNSLSAITMEDFLARAWRPSGFGRAISPARARLVLSRLLTVLWGAFCLGAGLVLARSSRTIIELVNMVGSAFYGPMLSVFAAGILCRRIRGRDMLCGLLAGVAANLVLWRWAPGVSWLWWNPAGFLAAVLTALAMSLLPLRTRGQGLSGRGAAGLPGIEEPPAGQILSGLYWRGSRRAVLALALYFALIVCVAAVLQEFLSRLHP